MSMLLLWLKVIYYIHIEGLILIKRLMSLRWLLFLGLVCKYLGNVSYFWCHYT